MGEKRRQTYLYKGKLLEGKITNPAKSPNPRRKKARFKRIQTMK
jgi:hypothetical protein